MRVVVIGAGISGIATADVLKKNGFEVVVLEKSASVGGVWALAYPEVRLQNVDFQYHLSDLPWPTAPDLHPTGAQIRGYWEHAVEVLGLDVRRNHEVVSVQKIDAGWSIVVRHLGVESELTCDCVVVAVGQYSEGKRRPTFAGEEEFGGEIVTERDVRSLDAFADERVVVVGFGKSALDMANLAAMHGATVHHVFRTPRWVLPQYVLGLHSSWLIFNRLGSVMMTSWAHPTAIERFLHSRMRGLVHKFWQTIAGVVKWQARRAARGTSGAERVEAVLPTHPLLQDLRSAVALAPEGYYRRVAEGKIEPRRAEIAAFEKGSVHLSTGERIDCDRVVLSLGSESPRFPFLSADLRALLEGESDGAQLYRHILHPQIDGLAFAGFNHGFLHVPAAEVGAQWLACVWKGELTLPTPTEMEATVAHVQQWKREHIAFEPSRSCAINTRYQQYLDIMLQELGVSPYRKLPNVVAEIFARYGAADYAGVGATIRERPKRMLKSLPLHT